MDMTAKTHKQIQKLIDNRHLAGKLLYQLAVTRLIAVVALVAFSCTATSVAAQTSQEACPTPAALQPDAFDGEMTFAIATNKGNMTTSTWIAATGEITPETPSRFKEILESEAYHPNEIVLHSRGGNLAAGLEFGRMIREAGLTAHIGRTSRIVQHEDEDCYSWWDEVKSGVCMSSCAYAFLGGQDRFVDSPYYPTKLNWLGFHQFYGNNERGADMLTASEVAEFESSTLSIAQALTGQIVLYAIEMGVDPSLVAFAAATPSDSLYFPTPAELEELSIASGKGLQAWFMEPYAAGLVTAARPQRSDSLLEQITAFCQSRSGSPEFLITMGLATPSYTNPDDLPLHAIELIIDGKNHRIARSSLDLRYDGDVILITVPVGFLRDEITNAQELHFRTDAARVMGGFSEGRALDNLARQSLALAWKNCI